MHVNINIELEISKKKMETLRKVFFNVEIVDGWAWRCCQSIMIILSNSQFY